MDFILLIYYIERNNMSYYTLWILFLFFSYAPYYAAQLGDFEPVGNYPCSTPIVYEFPTPDKQTPIKAALPFRYKELSLDEHIIQVPERTSTQVTTQNQRAVAGPLCPCIALAVRHTTIPKVLFAHLFYQNSRISACDKIKETFGHTSPHNIQILLHSTVMPLEYYNNETIFNNQPPAMCWKAHHKELSQQEEMRHTADIISYVLSIPKENITVNLFKYDDSLANSDYSSAQSCISVDYKGNVNSICMKRYNLHHTPHQSIYTFSNGHSLHTIDHTNRLNYLVDQKLKDFYPSSYNTYHQVDLIDIQCLNCGFCNKCVDHCE